MNDEQKEADTEDRDRNKDPLFRDLGVAIMGGETYSGSLGHPQLSLGVTSATAEFHEQLQSKPEFDVGGMLVASAVDQNGLTTGGYAAGLAHLSLPALNNWAVGVYGQSGFGMQKNPDGTNTQGLTGSLTPAVSWQKDGGTATSLTFNLVGSLAKSGSLDRGPTMPGLSSAGILVGLGLHESTTIETDLSHSNSLKPHRPTTQKTSNFSTLNTISYTYTNVMHPGASSGGKTTGALTVGASLGLSFGSVHGNASADSPNGSWVAEEFRA